MQGVPSILSLFCNEFNKFNDTRDARCAEHFISSNELNNKEFLAIRRAISLNETFVLFC